MLLSWLTVGGVKRIKSAVLLKCVLDGRSVQLSLVQCNVTFAGAISLTITLATQRHGGATKATKTRANYSCRLWDVNSYSTYKHSERQAICLQRAVNEFTSSQGFHGKTSHLIHAQSHTLPHPSACNLNLLAWVSDLVFNQYRMPNANFWSIINVRLCNED